ncbi:MULTISPECIES: hypothetical protein [unclassified Arthrobacter]|uniref:hypothetical protein n=1 Tax=unclassified Arthrobacter TaxID=235627 RepID=UPI001C853729|nr:hypothetical protein [Arthrobacter sp. MAHUQ-56]MBX7444695.1 hypothetical protein [Arthrobacter sp. MAHUQ-56]
MATDALDPGPNGDYPYLPRNPDGTLDTDRMPVGIWQHPTAKDRNGNPVLMDVEATLPDGRRVSDIAPIRKQ